MANLLITRPLADYESLSLAPPAMNIFTDEDKRAVVAMPMIEGGIVSWTVPDTSKNRSLFKQNYEPSGLFSCETIDEEEPTAKFKVAASKGKAAPGKPETLQTQPVTLTPAPKAAPKKQQGK